MDKVRVAVIGAGAFGKNHLRVLHESPIRRTGCGRRRRYRPRGRGGRRDTVAARSRMFRELFGQIDAAIVAAPTSVHAEIGCALLERGIDVLVEKPIAR